MQKRQDTLAAGNYAIPYVVTRHSTLAARGDALSGKTGALNGLIPYTDAICAADHRV